jgi:hypothetical protein
MTARASEQELVARLGADVLAGRWGTAVRQAIADRAAIALNLAAHNAPARPDLLATVDELLTRVTELAPTLHQLDAALAPEMSAAIEQRLAASTRERNDEARSRLTSMLERQRASLAELGERRARLVRQMDAATLAIARVRYETRRLRDRKPTA